MGEALEVNLDEQIMPYIDMANLACAFHAGDPVTMHKCQSFEFIHHKSH